MKQVVLMSADGDRVELFIRGSQLDWVHLHRFRAPRRESMTYERPEDIERAMLVRFRDLTARGYQVVDEPPRGIPALAIDPDVLEVGFTPFFVRRLEPAQRQRAGAMLLAFERTGLSSNPGRDEQATIPHLPALVRYVRETGTQILVLDGEPRRDQRQSSPDVTLAPPHRAWLRGWLAALRAEPPSALHTLALRACRLHDFDPTELGERLRPYPNLAFVGGMPTDFTCAAHARRLTLGLTDPGSALADDVLRTLASTTLAVDHLAIEAGLGRQVVTSKLAETVGAACPSLRDLAVAGHSALTLVNALVAAAVLPRLQRLRIDAWLTSDDLDVLCDHADALRHLEALELRIVPGTDTAKDAARVAAVLPQVEQLPDESLPVCPY